MVILSNKVTLCQSFWRKGTGLMFKKRTPDFAYVFPFNHPRRLVITMVFVFFPIDILFLKEGKVVEIARNVRPFSHYTPAHLADTFIEFPVGKVKRSFLGKRLVWNNQVVEMPDK
ncbi:MAG: DUF192 domain-containing protein [Nanoarchaeota archaeon]|nr:DUF192 domain-containing protein [Nanoarchaeota archaeon]